jgi:hypothetical protein
VAVCECARVRTTSGTPWSCSLAVLIAVRVRARMVRECVCARGEAERAGGRGGAAQVRWTKRLNTTAGITVRFRAAHRPPRPAFQPNAQPLNRRTSAGSFRRSL